MGFSARMLVLVLAWAMVFHPTRPVVLSGAPWPSTAPVVSALVD